MNWTCDKTRHWLLRQKDLPDAAIEHLAQCVLCQELAELFTEEPPEQGAASPAVSQLLVATQQQLSREKGLVAQLRSLSTQSQLALGLCIALLPVGLQLVLARRGDWAEYPWPRLLLVVTAYVFVIAFAARSLLSPLHQPISSVSKWTPASLALGLPLIIAATAPAHVTEYVQMSPALPMFMTQAGLCLRYGTLLALPGILILLGMDRQQGRGRYFLTIIATLGGAVGNFVLLLHCANEDPAHQLLGHATVGLVLFVLVGAALSVTRKRARANSS
jgi:hypothetical protein